ncbi:hypothetical protein BS17DRAFT_713527, partial [Gyrodon lividus]
PSYSSQQQQQQQQQQHGSSSSTSPDSLPPTFKTKPTNHLALSNESSTIKGEFVIDPSIRIPHSLLPPLTEDEDEADRKNLRLSSKFGSIKAEVWLLSSSRSECFSVEEQKRTTVDLSSDHGSIRVQMHNIQGAAPFLVTARAPHGTVGISLPRSFHGFLSLSTQHGNVWLADTLSQNSTQLSQVDYTRRYFVGDFSSLGDAEWTGDELRIEAKHGQIRIQYVDDAVADDQLKGGFLGWLFGK